MRVTMQAPAKLNLALAVAPSGDDGMHPIASWMVTVDLHDDLTVTSLPDDRLSRYAIDWHDEAKRRSDIDWSITRDLAVRAHLAMEAHAGRSLPVQLHLRKRIPVGAGLGGGSSDAAAMLRAVAAVHELGCSPGDLAAIGADLGADVAFLVHGGSALVQGRGDRVEPHETLPDLHAVLVFPEEGCATDAVYRRFDELSLPGTPLERVRSMIGAPLAPDSPFNDLSPAAIAVAPDLETLRSTFHALARRPVHVAGSGSTLFALCDDAAAAAAMVASVEAQLDMPAVAVTACDRSNVVPA